VSDKAETFVHSHGEALVRKGSPSVAVLLLRAKSTKGDAVLLVGQCGAGKTTLLLRVSLGLSTSSVSTTGLMLILFSFCSWTKDVLE
jgi:ABC-type nitrate/sulfonate/bicarbonate transport system ATPase subunit